MAIKLNQLAQASLSLIQQDHFHQFFVVIKRNRSEYLLGERVTTLLKYKYLPQQMEDEVDLSSLGWKSQTLAEMTSIEQGELSYSSNKSSMIALKSKGKKPCVWTKPV